MIREGLMDDSDSALAVDCETDQNGNCRKISIDEVLGAVQWVNPNNCISGAECLEWLRADFIRTVSLANRAINQRLT